MSLFGVKWRDKSGCWASKDYGSWCEHYEAIDLGKKKGQYCPFHAPQGSKGISLTEFNELVFKEIDRCRSERKTLDFTGAIFEGDISFAGYGKGNSFPPVKFDEATFYGVADFEEVFFSGDTSFEKTVFAYKATFTRAVFEGKAYFFDALFNEEVEFNQTEFLSDVYISFGSFKKGAQMEDVAYRGKAMLKRPIVE